VCWHWCSKLFPWFFWLYNAGVVITSAMLIWHGSLTVLAEESTKMIAGIAGIAGIGHMLLSAASCCSSSLSGE